MHEFKGARNGPNVNDEVNGNLLVKKNCPRCSKKHRRKSIARLMPSYKTDYNRSKWSTPGRNSETSVYNSKMMVNESRADKNFKHRKMIKVNVFNSPCAVDEFDDVDNNAEDIDEEIFAKIETIVEKPDLRDDESFENFLGFGVIKEVIYKTVIWPLKKPEIFKGLRTPPKGILLFGPPGTGKTSIGKSIAYETNSTFFNISPSTLISKWLGESEKLVRAMFLIARARQPSIIFVDEVDSLLSQRIPDENGCIRRMKNEFLICMDSIEVLSTQDRILVIGATNRPSELDEAARRRFFKRFYIPLPDKQARKDTLLKLLERENHSLEEIDINELVKKTEGYSLADLKNLSQEAAMGPIKTLSNDALHFLKPRDIRPISLEDFFSALQLIKPTVSVEQVHSYEIWDSLYGYGGESSRCL